MSKEAKQCEVEVARIAVRTQNVLGTLDAAKKHFSEQAGLEANLLELENVLESVKVLVGRCGTHKMPRRIKDAILKQKNPNKQALINTENKLETITQRPSTKYEGREGVITGEGKFEENDTASAGTNNRRGQEWTVAKKMRRIWDGA